MRCENPAVSSITEAAAPSQVVFFHILRCLYVINVPVFLRQCALAALRDVKSYLKDEGGQVAVSFTSGTINNLEEPRPLCEYSVGTFVTLRVRSRSLTPLTQPGTGER